MKPILPCLLPLLVAPRLSFPAPHPAPHPAVRPAVAAPAPVAAQETLTTDISTAAGVKWEFKPEGSDWKPINVPAGGWRAQGYTCDAGTYRSTVGIPSTAKGRLVRVAFAAINFGADVFAGKDEAHLTKVASH